MRLPDIPKNIRVFWKLFCSTFKKKEKPIRTMGSKQGGQSVLNGILLIWSGYYAGSIWRNGEIQYRTVFLKLPASSTPPFRVRVFSFLIPPHLFLPSTALPSGCRIVFRLNLKIPPSFHLSLSGQGAGEKWRENNHCGENTKSSCISGKSRLMVCSLVKT